MIHRPFKNGYGYKIQRKCKRLKDQVHECIVFIILHAVYQGFLNLSIENLEKLPIFYCQFIVLTLKSTSK